MYVNKRYFAYFQVFEINTLYFLFFQNYKYFFLLKTKIEKFRKFNLQNIHWTLRLIKVLIIRYLYL